MAELSGSGEVDPGCSIEKDEEYAAQFFGFTPQSFINGIYNMCCEYLNESMKALNEGIVNTYKDKVSKMEVKDVSNRKARMVMQKFDKFFDSAEAYMMKNIFKIPPGVVLPEDRAHIESPCSEAEHHDLESSIQVLEDRILAVKYANAKLEQRVTRLDTVRVEFKKMSDKIQETQGELHPAGAFESQTKFREAVRDLRKTMDVLEEVSGVDGESRSK